MPLLAFPHFAKGDFWASWVAAPASTMLNILGCLDRPTSGRYFMGRCSLDDNELSDIRLKYLGSSFRVSICCTVDRRGKHCLPLYYLGWTEERSSQQARELVPWWVSKTPGASSQRAFRRSAAAHAIARALANDPVFLPLMNPLETR